MQRPAHDRGARSGSSPRHRGLEGDLGERRMRPSGLLLLRGYRAASFCSSIPSAPLDLVHPHQQGRDEQGRLRELADVPSRSCQLVGSVRFSSTSRAVLPAEVPASPGVSSCCPQPPDASSLRHPREPTAKRRGGGFLPRVRRARVLACAARTLALRPRRSQRSQHGQQRAGAAISISRRRGRQVLSPALLGDGASLLPHAPERASPSLHRGQANLNSLVGDSLRRRRRRMGVSEGRASS
mmetsp:Transcript_17814/g.58592  ORF Transcript_17814/g.58592 Transcript_17814/m.58592 type:complete len:240 (+) Transcript_17814:1020-1739(+)